MCSLSVKTRVGCFLLLQWSRDLRVNIEKTNIEYSVEGHVETTFSKDYSIVESEVNVFYKDIFDDDAQEGLPVTIFSQGLSPLQAIVKYLRDKGNSFVDIARLINRDQRTIWATYNVVKDERLKITEVEVFIPASVFSNRNLSTLEALVKYLLDMSFSVKKISGLLGKDYQTIWTVKNRIAKKGGASW